MSLRRFSSFLENAKATVKLPKRSVTLVLGNEAADLDSVVSSLAYAFLRHTNDVPPNTQTNRPTYIPVVAIPRADFPLRTECTFALRDAFPTVDFQMALTFLDDINLDDLAETTDLSLVLVDHNRLSPSLEKFAGHVTGVLDHHKDEGCNLEANPRMIAPVGSATTLIVEEWAKYLTVNGTVQPNVLEPELARLLLGPILLDTVNLQVEYGRTTERDKQAVEFLLPFVRGAKMSDEDNRAFVDQLYNGLHKAKFSVSNLTSYDLLRKDYKEWIIGPFRLGISSISWHVGSENGWAVRDGNGNEKAGLMQLRASCHRFAQEKQLDCHLLLTAFDYSMENPTSARGFERELMVCFDGKLATNVQAMGQISRALKASELQLEALTEGEYYIQKNVTCSRKQVQPIMQHILENIGQKL
ncbi:inorganic diphosphatase [Spizellomyces sp. 'palustris']|nr:inorganic diphosphatase [Spizellomyces sp. 'palustris']